MAGHNVLNLISEDVTGGHSLRTRQIVFLSSERSEESLFPERN
jgi:hypothetical protein